MSESKKQVTDADRIGNLQSEIQRLENTNRLVEAARAKAEARANKWEERFDTLLRAFQEMR